MSPRAIFEGLRFVVVWVLKGVRQNVHRQKCPPTKCTMRVEVRDERRRRYGMPMITSETCRLSSYEPLEGAKKAPCPGCKQNRMFFCYDCRTPMPGVFTPQVTLPCQVDVIKHPMEKNSKSSALHCKIVAPTQTRVFDQPDVHDYRNDSDAERAATALIFPSKSAITVEEFVRTRGPIKRIVVLDCTWFQVGVMQRIPEIQGLTHVCLREYRTAFWRPQHNVNDTHLATIEAIYFALREIRELSESSSYQGEFDDLLYWFFYTKSCVEEKQRQYRLRLGKSEIPDEPQ